MQLVGTYVLQSQSVRRTLEMAAELGDSIEWPAGEPEPTTQWLATMSAELRAAVAALLSPPTCGEGVKDPDISG